jgi:excisionase family DNA binding protein
MTSVRRLYSTRELAEMWNVSESTVKRWADTGELVCIRTLGGHRKFELEQIHAFQSRHGFRSTGILSKQQWGLPKDEDLESLLNQGKFEKIRETVLYLAVQNRTALVKELLERVYLRGVALAELYDDVIMPTGLLAETEQKSARLSLGQLRLFCNNLESALSLFFPDVVHRKRNGKTALCAGVRDACGIAVNGGARILEAEGWECLNLGAETPLHVVSEMVEKEPVNLVCLFSFATDATPGGPADFRPLSQVAGDYRLPVALFGSAFADPALRQVFVDCECFSSFCGFKKYASRLAA